MQKTIERADVLLSLCLNHLEVLKKRERVYDNMEEKFKVGSDSLIERLRGWLRGEPDLEKPNYNIGTVRVLDYLWLNDGRGGLTGLVLGDNGFEVNFYIGTATGTNERFDVQWVVEWGTKIPLGVLQVLIDVGKEVVPYATTAEKPS